MPDILNDNLEGEDGQYLSYGGFPFISNIDSYVKNELTYRAEKRTRSATPYIKITPGFSKDGSVTSKVVMKGIEAPNDRDPSTYQFNELYRPDHFYRPLAGVKSVNVDYKNAYGSTRKATISWVCHTLEDLERLSPYFLNPGYTVFIEWGWSDKAAAAITNNPNINIENAFRYGKIYQKYTDGNYDCMLGVTTNYSFSMNRDGGFECTTEVISAGYLMEGMTIPNQFTTDSIDARKRYLMSEAGGQKSETEANDQIKLEEEKEKSFEDAKMQTLQFFLKESFHLQLNTEIANNTYMDSNTKDDIFIYVPFNTAYTRSSLIQNEEESKKKYELSGDLDDDRNEHLNSKVIRETKKVETQRKTIKIKFEAKIPESKTGDTYEAEMESYDPSGEYESKEVEEKKEVEVAIRPMTYISWGYIEDKILNPHIKITTKDPNKKYFEFNSKDSKISMHGKLRTTDLGVCILPVWNRDTPPPVPDFRRNETDENTYNYGYIRRVLINADWFREIMLNATTILEGVLQIWSGVNDACINYWNFKLKSTDQFYGPTKDEIENSDKYKQILPEQNVYVYKDPKTRTENEEFQSELTTNENEPAIIKYSIIDINYADKIVAKELGESGNIYMFRTKSFPIEGTDKRYTSIVRNLNFQSKLSSQVALNVFYSAQNSDGKVLGNPQTNTFRSLYDYRIDGELFNISKDTFSLHPLKIDTTKRVEDTTKRELGTSVEVELQDQSAYGYTLNTYLPVQRTDYEYTIPPDTTKFTGIEGMKILVSTNDEPYQSSVATALVPLDCEVELEGISGLRIGNIFTLDHLPDIYTTKGVFQIIGLTDTIDKNSWVTKVKSQFRVFNDIDYHKAKTGTQKSTGRTPNLPLGNITADEIVLYNKKQIDLKTSDEVVDFEALKTKNKNLRDVLLNANAYSMKYFNKVVTVTDIHRKRNESIANPGSKHLTWEGADLRSDKYTADERIRFKAHLNTIADYVLYHFGTGWHFHIEVRK